MTEKNRHRHNPRSEGWGEPEWHEMGHDPDPMAWEIALAAEWILIDPYGLHRVFYPDLPDAAVKAYNMAAENLGYASISYADVEDFSAFWQDYPDGVWPDPDTHWRTLWEEIHGPCPEEKVAV